ncbi:MAG TPA: adenosylcobinamide-GDP ribazoletransferase [Gemmatimonadaceae bacterium]
MSAHRRSFIAAFTFLTRLPVGGVAAHDASDLPLSVIYFPVVGLVIGLLGGIAFVAAHHLWSTPVAVLLSMATTVLATGAFHEDALADSFDGFGGGWNREQVLAIMKDSRVGSYALVGVALTLAIKAGALWTLATTVSVPGWTTDAFVVRALVAGHVLGRWSSIPLIWRLPYVRLAQDGERASAGKPFIDGVTVNRVAIATVLTVLIVSIALGWRALTAGGVALLVTVLAGAYFVRRIGGITGDALGAANQIVEVCVYLALAARLG